MLISLCGHGDSGANCLEALLGEGFRLAGVFTHPDRAEVRTGCRARSVAGIARTRGLEPVVVEPGDKECMLEALRDQAPDLIVSVNWRVLFTEEMLAVPTRGAINLHGSLLPRWRGNSPLTWALIAGDTEAGVTVHFIDAGMDTGDILGQKRVKITPHDTIATLKKRVGTLDAPLLVECLRGLVDGTLVARPQDHDQAVIARKRRPEDGTIDWNLPAARIHDWVRAMTAPLPGAFTHRGEEALYVWRISHMPLPAPGAEPGTVVAHCSGTEFDHPLPVVATGNGVVILEEATVEERRGPGLAELMERDWLRTGERLGGKS